MSDTLKALEMGAVDILIVWENQEVIRYVLKNHSSDGKLISRELNKILML